MIDFGAGCFWAKNVGVLPAIILGLTIKMAASTYGFLVAMRGGGIVSRIVVLVSWPFTFAIC